MQPAGNSFWHAKAAIAKQFARKPPIQADTRDTLCEIARGLYLSSCHLEAQRDTLKQANITHVLQVGTELTPTHPGLFLYKNIPVLDLEEEDLVKYFQECFRFIDAGREAGAVLVHCAAGISRSATVVIAYLMAHGSLSLEDARSAVKAARPAINPNQGFLLQLQLFQEAGFSTEGWQPWNLDRFLQVRSAAYPRAEAVPAGNADVRGACEVAPPELSREESLSAANSPVQSPARKGRPLRPVALLAAGAAAAGAGGGGGGGAGPSRMGVVAASLASGEVGGADAAAEQAAAATETTGGVSSSASGSSMTGARVSASGGFGRAGVPLPLPLPLPLLPPPPPMGLVPSPLTSPHKLYPQQQHQLDAMGAGPRSSLHDQVWTRPYAHSAVHAAPPPPPLPGHGPRHTISGIPDASSSSQWAWAAQRGQAPGAAAPQPSAPPSASLLIAPPAADAVEEGSGAAALGLDGAGGAGWTGVAGHGSSYARPPLSPPPMGFGGGGAAATWASSAAISPAGAVPGSQLPPRTGFRASGPGGRASTSGVWSVDQAAVRGTSAYAAAAAAATTAGPPAWGSQAGTGISTWGTPNYVHPHRQHASHSQPPQSLSQQGFPPQQTMSVPLQLSGGGGLPAGAGAAAAAAAGLSVAVAQPPIAAPELSQEHGSAGQGASVAAVAELQEESSAGGSASGNEGPATAAGRRHHAPRRSMSDSLPGMLARVLADAGAGAGSGELSTSAAAAVAGAATVTGATTAAISAGGDQGSCQPYRMSDAGAGAAMPRYPRVSGSGTGMVPPPPPPRQSYDGSVGGAEVWVGHVSTGGARISMNGSGGSLLAGVGADLAWGAPASPPATLPGVPGTAREGEGRAQGAEAASASTPGLTWAQTPVLTPAGLDRTPSKAMATPKMRAAAAAMAAAAAQLPPSASPDSMISRTVRELFGAASGEGLAATAGTTEEAEGQEADPTGAREALLAMTAPGVRSDADLVVSRSNSMGGAAAGLAAAAAAASASASGSASGSAAAAEGAAGAQGPGRGGRGGASALAAAGGAAATAAAPGGGGKGASRLATATFADSGVGLGPPRLSEGGYALGSQPSVDGRSNGGSSGSAGGTGTGHGGTAAPAGAGPGLGRVSAPSAMAYNTSASGLAAFLAPQARTEAQPSAGGTPPSSAPVPMTTGPAAPGSQPLDLPVKRLSIRSRAAGSSAGGSSAAGDSGAEVGTPIHKRVLRSLTSLLRVGGGSPGSSAGGAVSADAGSEASSGGGAGGGPGKTGGAPASGGSSPAAEEQARAAPRRRLWSSTDNLASGAAAAAAAAAARASAAVPTAAAPSSSAGVNTADSGADGAAAAAAPPMLVDDATAAAAASRGAGADVLLPRRAQPPLLAPDSIPGSPALFQPAVGVAAGQHGDPADLPPRRRSDTGSVASPTTTMIYGAGRGGGGGGLGAGAGAGGGAVGGPHSASGGGEFGPYGPGGLLHRKPSRSGNASPAHTEPGGMSQTQAQAPQPLPLPLLPRPQVGVGMRPRRSDGGPVTDGAGATLNTSDDGWHGVAAAASVPPHSWSNGGAAATASSIPDSSATGLISPARPLAAGSADAPPYGGASGGGAGGHPAPMGLLPDCADVDDQASWGVDLDSLPAAPFRWAEPEPAAAPGARSSAGPGAGASGAAAAAGAEAAAEGGWAPGLPGFPARPMSVDGSAAGPPARVATAAAPGFAQQGRGAGRSVGAVTSSSQCSASSTAFMSASAAAAAAAAGGGGGGPLTAVNGGIAVPEPGVFNNDTLRPAMLEPSGQLSPPAASPAGAAAATRPPPLDMAVVPPPPLTAVALQAHGGGAAAVAAATAGASVSGAMARRPRTSYSGALSMMVPPASMAVGGRTSGIFPPSPLPSPGPVGGASGGGASAASAVPWTAPGPGVTSGPPSTTHSATASPLPSSQQHFGGSEAGSPSPRQRPQLQSGGGAVGEGGASVLVAGATGASSGGPDGRAVWGGSRATADISSMMSELPASPAQQPGSQLRSRVAPRDHARQPRSDGPAGSAAPRTSSGSGAAGAPRSLPPAAGTSAAVAATARAAAAPRSTSAGSSALPQSGGGLGAAGGASIAAAAGQPAAGGDARPGRSDDGFDITRIWEHLRAVRQQQHQELQQQQEQQAAAAAGAGLHSQSSPIPPPIFRSEGGASDTSTVPLAVSSPNALSSSSNATTALAISSSPTFAAGDGAATAAAALAAASAAAVARTSNGGGTVAGGSATARSSTSREAPASAPAGFAGGGGGGGRQGGGFASPASSSAASSSVVSPRAPPAMMRESTFDGSGGGGGGGGGGTADVHAPAVLEGSPSPSHRVPLRPARGGGGGGGAGAGNGGSGGGRPDASLLRPVLGIRRLLPMPSPSCIVATPTGTPRAVRSGSVGAATSGGGHDGAGPADASGTSHPPRRGSVDSSVRVKAAAAAAAAASLVAMLGLPPQAAEDTSLPPDTFGVATAVAPAASAVASPFGGTAGLPAFPAVGPDADAGQQLGAARSASSVLPSPGGSSSGAGSARGSLRAMLPVELTQQQGDTAAAAAAANVPVTGTAATAATASEVASGAHSSSVASGANRSALLPSRSTSMEQSAAAAAAAASPMWSPSAVRSPCVVAGSHSGSEDGAPQQQ
ncbi:hypothetical protein HYH02_011870 [Chlamydomonas schloesseri]|uniref:Protein-serine/threonine phosphatase n=1 Tax=Chlamydomonas schloesseri TaxID=2026947 RepID=A0A835TCB1_9CHLO|nr:hypothetical protein HYH02_011870 [Chlamydomonas schloesseri]|eukprot:KAG2435576.1 hypothetical protein HYH02_011870 [Chlamydomonas schloesseri]